MTEKMKKTLARILEETIEPLSNLSLSDLEVVKGIKFDPATEKFSVYLDLHRMTLVTSTFFYHLTGKIHLEEVLTAALKRVYPRFGIRYFYVGGPRSKSPRLRKL